MNYILHSYFFSARVNIFTIFYCSEKSVGCLDVNWRSKYHLLQQVKGNSLHIARNHLLLSHAALSKDESGK